MKKYENFCKAVDNLKECTKLNEPYSVIETTGIIGLFSICFEQAWKVMKETLEYNGRIETKTGSPRMIIKTAYQCGMIDNEDVWIEILETRNILANTYHTYDEKAAADTVSRIKSAYLPVFEKLRQDLSDLSSENL